VPAGGKYAAGFSSCRIYRGGGPRLAASIATFVARDTVLPTQSGAVGLGFILRRLPAKELVMTTLRDIVKDRRVYSIDAGRTVLEAARFMMEHNIGALPVLRDGVLAGIVSERDIMNRVVAVGRTPGTTAVSEVMTANPRAVDAEETIEECLFIMREFGFRHLPIVEGKELKGVVSLRDVLLRHSAEIEREARRAAS
jgi:CBS domain-containing protein